MMANYFGNARVSDAAREQINAGLRESRLERIAAEMWSDAIDRHDYVEAERIAKETSTWFTNG
ncbi:MAG: hypothetical protein WCE63_04995 [Acidobacteriaceae bacterium]